MFCLLQLQQIWTCTKSFPECTYTHIRREEYYSPVFECEYFEYSNIQIVLSQHFFCCRSRVPCITPTKIKYLIYMIRVLSRPIKISRIVNRYGRVKKLYPTRTARIWRFTIADTATETHEDLRHNSGHVQYNFCVFLSALRHMIKWTVFIHHHDGRFCVQSVDLR